jgi:pilus assembly protein CpaB
LRRRTLTIALAGLLALIGAVAVLAYARQANERAVNGLKAETVMVAAGAINAGTSLGAARQEGLLSTEKVPVSSLTNPAVQSVTAQNRHLVVSGAVAKGQVLLLNMLASSASVTTSGGFLIPPGKVAVTVDMCVAEAVADYVTPGSHVAVFDTVANTSGSEAQRSCGTGHTVINSGAISNSQNAATLLVLKSALVLAVGQNAGTQSTSGNSSATVSVDPATSSSSSQNDVLVTLAVPQSDAERLILIDEVGLPYMALLPSSPDTQFMAPPRLFQDPYTP